MTTVTLGEAIVQYENNIRKTVRQVAGVRKVSVYSEHDHFNFGVKRLLTKSEINELHTKFATLLTDEYKIGFIEYDPEICDSDEFVYIVGTPHK